MLEVWRLANEIWRGSIGGALIDQPDMSIHGFQRWLKPAPWRYKCSIDASFSSSLDRMRIGMCIRDENGCFVLTKTLWYSLLCSVEEGEAFGLYNALVWVADLLMNNVDFHLDSKKLGLYEYLRLSNCNKLKKSCLSFFIDNSGITNII